MDLFKILINPLSLTRTCFLCFKQNDETLSVYQKLFICDENTTSDTTLDDIMKYLFPSQDILFGQACTNCTDFLLNTFKVLRKHDIMKNVLCKISSTVYKEVEYATQMVSSTKQFYIKLNLPTFCNTLPKYTSEYLNQESCDNSNKFDFKFNFKDSDKDGIVKYEDCGKCNMKFESKDHLNLHEKLTHKNLNQSAICEFCGKDCKKPALLKVHLNCHREKTCPYCSKTLKSHSHFNVHVRNHEVNVKKASRKSHYACNICSFKSFNKNSLEAHVNKVHLQIRPYVCNTCNKGFYKKSNLTEHLMIHAKVKTLTCEQCGETFATKKTLIEHLRLHSGERPFQCEICSLTFVTSGRRLDHFKRKHMEKNICCFVCDKKFSLRKEVNSHMKKVHGHIKSREDSALIEPNKLFSQILLDKDVLMKL